MRAADHWPAACLQTRRLPRRLLGGGLRQDARLAGVVRRYAIVGQLNAVEQIFSGQFVVALDPQLAVRTFFDRLLDSVDNRYLALGAGLELRTDMHLVRRRRAERGVAGQTLRFAFSRRWTAFSQFFWLSRLSSISNRWL